MSYFEDYARALFDRLRAVVTTDANGAEIPVQQALDAWRGLTVVRQRP